MDIFPESSLTFAEFLLKPKGNVETAFEKVLYK